MVAQRALLITSDEELAEEALQLAAVAGCELDRATSVVSAEHQWRRAPLVLIDETAAIAGIPEALPRRRVALIHRRSPGPELWRTAFEIGAEQTIELSAEGGVLVDLLAEVVDGSAPRSGRVLAVLGGRGGAGASVLAAAAAVTAARRGDRCLLLDCDPLGGGLDLALGTEGVAGLRWSGLTVSGGRVAAGALHQALPERKLGSGVLSVLSCDRGAPSSGLTPDAVRAVIDAGRRSGQTVVCDLPRNLSEAATAGLRQADLTLVVVPAEVRACAAAARLVAGISDASPGPAFAVVRGPAPSGLKVADVARAVGLDVLTAMRAQPGLPAALDRGGLCSGSIGARGSVVRVARKVLTALEGVDSSAGSRMAVA